MDTRPRTVTTNASGFRYPHAPIAEAVVDLRVLGVAEDKVPVLGGFQDLDYPKREESVLMSAEVQSGALGLATKTVRQMNGFRFTSEDGLQIAQLRTDGFTFSRLAPYEEWSTFYTEARRLWLEYQALVTPSTVGRLALRYINQIQMPVGELKIDTYLRTRPEISDDMPNSTSGYFMTVDIPLPAHQATARITQTILGGDDSAALSPRLVLDIDVYSETVIVPGEPSGQDQIDETFTRLRLAKNMVFEASITDQSRELFR